MLRDLQSRNERMFLLTLLVLNLADTKQKLDKEVFGAAAIAQKYNCILTRLDYRPAQGLMSLSLIHILVGKNIHAPLAAALNGGQIQKTLEIPG